MLRCLSDVSLSGLAGFERTDPVREFCFVLGG
jgi:hypothetical protein